jgi:hypothetical protein
MLEWARQLQCTCGDISTVSTDEMMLSCPSWINEADIPFRPVEFTPEAERALSEAIDLRKLMAKKYKIDFIAADSVENAKILIQQVSLLHRNVTHPFIMYVKLMNFAFNERFFNKTLEAAKVEVMQIAQAVNITFALIGYASISKQLQKK